MDAKGKRYRKSARQRAKEYLRKRRGYKTKEEKRAFYLAEKVQICRWRESLRTMSPEECARQKKAFFTYLCSRYRIGLFAAAGFLALLVAVLLIILL